MAEVLASILVVGFVLYVLALLAQECSLLMDEWTGKRPVGGHKPSAGRRRR